MSHRVIVVLTLFSCAVVACARLHAAGTVNVAPLTETEKIERLISTVETLKDATFVRKGTEYDAATAAKFLRGKWDLWKDSVQTARDFVTLASGGNFGTGTPYIIRFKDGTEQKSGEFLAMQLAKLEGGAATQPAANP